MASRSNLILILAVVLFATTVAEGQSAASVTIQANQPGAVVSSNVFGVFLRKSILPAKAAFTPR